MNPVDRAIFRLILIVLPFWLHRHFPHWVKVLLNRWMKHHGDARTE